MQKIKQTPQTPQTPQNIPEETKPPPLISDKITIKNIAKMFGFS